MDASAAALGETLHYTNGHQQLHEFNQPVWNVANTLGEKRTIRLLLIPTLTMFTTLTMTVLNYQLQANHARPEQMCYATYRAP